MLLINKTLLRLAKGLWGWICAITAVRLFSLAAVTRFAASISGGERQRIGIARCLLTDPDMIAMDEPTSSLDVFHEKELLSTLAEQYQDKTLLIISHRASTLSGCTRILQL